MFVKAGENYFDHETPPRWVIFQAIPMPAEGLMPDANYSMYAARLKRDAGGAGEITGIDTPVLLSAPGSANTCGWFHPLEPFRVLFGSTLVPPTATDTPGYSKDRNRYTWQFPEEMQVVSRYIRPAYDDTVKALADNVHVDFSVWPKDADEPALVVQRTGGYTAECSWSPDGRFILYTHVDPRTRNPNIWVRDTKHGGADTLLIGETGYNGGPFFSPDGRAIVYRSDRRGDSNLQLFYAALAFDDSTDPARITGIRREVALTDNQQVNWAPFFHPTRPYVVYAASELGHQNYEVYALELPGAGVMQATGPSADAAWPAQRTALRKARVTRASGFDGLPAFSADGSLMIFTSQRGRKLEREQRPSSQVWIAKYAGEPAWGWMPPPPADAAPAPEK